MKRRPQRINLSIDSLLVHAMAYNLIQGLTKMRIPSASVFHPSTILSSSVFAVSEYMLKRGPELSLKLDLFFDGRRPRSRYSGKICLGQGCAAAYTPGLPFSTSLAGIWFTTCAAVLEDVVRYGGIKSVEETPMVGGAPYEGCSRIASSRQTRLVFSIFHNYRPNCRKVHVLYNLNFKYELGNLCNVFLTLKLL